MPDLTVHGQGASAAACPPRPTAARRELMERIAPAGDVYQAGTLSGNPLAVAAGLRHAASCSTTRPTSGSPRLTRALADGPARGGRRAGPVQVASTPGPADRLLRRRAACATTPAPRPATRGLRALAAARCSTRGVYPPPSQFEAWFPSLAHDDEHVERTLEAAARGVRGGSR